MSTAFSLRQALLPLAAFALIVATAASTSAQISQQNEFVQGGDLIVAPVAGTSEYLAYSKYTGRWRSHSFPKDLKVVPVLGGTVAAFSTEGGEVDELVAVDRDGNWRICKLSKPTSANCVPVISEHVAAYFVGGRVYAFSAATGGWDSVDSTQPPAVSHDTVMITEPGRVAVFSAHTGAWAVARTRAAE